MTKYGPLVGAIDQGTSSSRFLVFAANTEELIAHHQIEVNRTCPRQGWVEEDAKILLSTSLICIEKTVEKLKDLGVDPRDIRAIGVTNQRETVIAWDKSTGEPLYKAILWCDTRTSKQVEEILDRPKEENEDRIRNISGIPITPFTSALKIRWLIDNVPEVQKAMNDNNCLVGNVDAWLIWNITGGKAGGIHITDVSNASCTHLMNLSTLQWDPFLCKYFNVPVEILPKIMSSSEIYGHMKISCLSGVPISACLGDQFAALVGQRCFNPGDAKCTYGTGCFLLCNTGENIIPSKHGLLTSVAYKLGPNKPAVYVLEGSVAVAGAGIRWLRDNLGISSTYEELDMMAASVKDSGGVYFVPAFSGLYAPYWRSDARGVICGLTEHSTKNHIARAAFEAVALQVRDVVEAVNKEDGCHLKSLKVDGGMSKNNVFMQLQADTLGISLIRPVMAETTALGVAMAAGSAEGIDVWKISSDKSCEVKNDVFHSKAVQNEQELRYWKWKQAVNRSLGWEVSQPKNEL